jgi:tyrosine-protein kinase Etk/Wzc
MQDSKHPAKSDSDLQEISLLDLFLVLAKRKSLVVGIPIFCSVVAAVISLLLPNVYTATARILPPQISQGSAAAVISQVSGLGAIAGSSLGLKNPADIYVGMLKSHSLSDALIQRFDLRKLYDKATLTDTRKALEGVSSISAGKEGIIAISVDDYDPQRAASLANAYVEELERLTHRLALTEAGQRRLFYERQLQDAKTALADAEVALKTTQERTGLIKLDEQGKVIIEVVAQLRSQIAAKEIQLASLRTFAADRNPEVIRAENELAGLKTQLRKMEKNTSKDEGDILVPTGRVPTVGLQYVRGLREVKYREAILEILARQFELAKIDEAKDAVVIQPLDKASVPDKKSRPKRTIIVLATAIVAMLVCVLLAFVLEALQRAAKDPQTGRKLHLLVSHLRLRHH